MLVLNQMKKHGLYMVRTGCLTYNHERFILDTMNGFVLQKTTFPVVYTVVDDASTDKTPEVLRQFMNAYFDLHEADVAYEKDTEYGHVTFARHKTNKNCYFAIIYLRENHFSQKKSKAIYLTEWMDTKYVALCEGDDYWTDPLKLQKQVDFLEGHPEFSMCFHGAEVKVENSPSSEQKNGTNYSRIENREYVSTEFVSGWLVPTASIVFRPEYVNQFEVKHPEKLVFGDIVLVLKCSHTGKVFGMSDMMSVYRIQPNSITNNPQSVESLFFRLPEHYRCLRQNFPKVEKGPLEWSISHYYYVRMKRQHNIVAKAKDFFMFVWWNPSNAWKKIRSVMKKRFYIGLVRNEKE